MIKKLFTSLLLSSNCYLFLQAQEAKNCFVHMPDSLCPQLSAVNRADFIDFLESKMKAEVTNRFGSKSEMTALTSDYIRVKMSSQSTWQMKLLPVNDSTSVICTVTTVCATACDSHIKFYTPSWQLLPTADYLPKLPAWEDFSKSREEGEGTSTDLSAIGIIPLLQAELSPDQPTLTFTLTTPDYMDREEGEKLRASLRPAIVYRWSQTRQQFQD